ncbi:Delta-1-pyrroline-5-carboxylate dehydrogenase, mitochondrial [Armadillidium nasatum]|uniref:Multifunctional fusion protein n=1 Tax=Armadillidium nasatum TaxID=96803 RepID=A0A5N5STF7_9CRUS|nr:Delta-1-pyrroline-5-carboxylate dehydrogenase, mitochondrial [Armadillidium nasatum]
MLSALRKNIISSAQRVGTRAASAIVGEPAVTDFKVENEPVYGYLPGSPERKELEATLKKSSNITVDVPIVIGDQEYRTEIVKYQPMPHNHKKKVAKFYYSTPELLNKAIDVAVKTREQWDRVPLNDKFNIWLKAADMMAGKYRQELNAATMLGQSKTVIQAEIDSAAELIDFLRFNALYAKEAIKWQPRSPDPNTTINSLRWRGLEGFVAAISPFNFTAIGGNLAYTPAMMGNGVLWKPSDTAVLSNYTIFKIMREAGVPPGVVNFVPADGPVFGKAITESPYLTFQWIWKNVGQNLQKYKNFPRLVGECGGKNFHLVHPSADIPSVVNGTIRSAFEFCGQKCSACSRLYVPESLWPKVKEGLVEVQKQLKIGDVEEFDSFAGAVIDETAFKRISGYIEHAKSSPNLNIIAGGKYDNSIGYFVEPTIVETKDPADKIMKEEIFGPVLATYVYPDEKLDSIVDLVDNTTPYALTGAIFAQDSGTKEDIRTYG